MLPELFLKRMQEMLQDEYPAFVKSLEGEPYRALRANTLKISAEELKKLSPVFLSESVPWEPAGMYYAPQDQPGRHPFHEAGLYYIQEPSAQAVVPFLEVQPGERVLDLCAAPGGKATQIASALQGEGLLLCNEIQPARARILSENIERMGVRNALVTNETPERLADFFQGYFDKILVDAPCSGEGMFRKTEEAGKEWSEEAVLMCAKRQDEVLEAAARMLCTGGRLVYSTCTFAPMENEGSVSRFLHSHPEFTLLQTHKPEGFLEGRADWVNDAAPDIAKTVRLMPHYIKGEGHFLAVLQKAGEKPVFARACAKGTEPSAKESFFAPYLEFARTYFSPKGYDKYTGGTMIAFGEQLYLGTADMPALRGLKVLRPGLHLGTVKKDRFEPSHALALALKKEEFSQCLNLQADSRQVRAYLGGQTLVTTETETDPNKNLKGWCLICVEGYSLGFGKVTGCTVKNHFPKGLRK